ncbi:MAG TPA: PSD1 and planctomycete cytochrome C domain-containing protein [Bryobacteraceae bacterium]|nr:PSD1 and planctomycete cytochrome C domain-containing protein [Bryobacteraceae bacterium]
MKVRPLLAKHCYTCHTEARAGGLQMDSQDAMMRGSKDGPVLVPGKPDESKLIQAIRYKDRVKMPPSGKLADDDIAALVSWVRSGAVWGHPAPRSKAKATQYVITPEARAFWSFQPVKQPPVPAVKDRSWARAPIDSFVLARLENAGLKPARPADRRTLIRRATLDLIGLPPTPDEVEAFEKDSSPRAFEKVVDRLLGSPQYGERWGRLWLDVARYSDKQLTAEGDGPLPNAFQYRDWVIRAFNEDMPYDQFVKAQIAGDLLPEAARAKYAGGVGFFSLSPKPEFRDERVDAATRGFLGLTVACAQCHDHKFDPIPTRDYYSLLGVLESTEEGKFPLAPADIVAVYDKQKKALDEEKAALNKFLDNQREQLFDIFALRTSAYVMASWKVLGPEKKSVAEVLAATNFDKTVLQGWIRFLEPARERKYEYLSEWVSLLQDPNGKLKAEQFAAKFENRILAVRKDEVELREKNAKIKAQEKEGAISKAIALDREKFYLLADLRAKARTEPRKKDAGPFYFSDDQLGSYMTSVWKEHFDTLRANIERLTKALPAEYPAYTILKDKAKPENLHVYIRGNQDDPGEEAPRQFLAILSPGEQVPFKQGSGRLELAEAIATPQNPLTARVMVNRIWMHHFGAGIVPTASNFGKLGEPPVNPELLDYLAGRFIQNGWSIKKMHKEIMLSGVYALSSEYSAANAQIDPENKLLWRANIRRLDVESMRDSMLFVSGKLDKTMGGPAVSLHDEKNFRRTLYGAISRAKPDQFLRLFDFPDPNETSERRIATNVPLQQLYFLNSPLMQQQAEMLAQRLSDYTSDQQKIKQAYSLLFNRPPTPQEIEKGAAFVTAQGNSWPNYLQVLLSANEFLYVN